MELEHLREYVVLARGGSFTDAARALHITQSTLSKHIAAIEHELGCELLVRSRKGCVLTAPGKLLYERALEVVALLDRTRADLANLPATPTAHAVEAGSARRDPALRRACASAAARFGLTQVQAGALALYLEGSTLDEVGITLECTRDDASILLADAYRALDASSKQQALERVMAGDVPGDGGLTR